MNVKLSVDTHCIKDTPKANVPYGVISGTIGTNPCELSLEEVAEVIENGYTISSPIYKNGLRKKISLRCSCSFWTLMGKTAVHWLIQTL